MAAGEAAGEGSTLHGWAFQLVASPKPVRLCLIFAPEASLNDLLSTVPARSRLAFRTGKLQVTGGAMVRQQIPPSDKTVPSLASPGDTKQQLQTLHTSPSQDYRQTCHLNGRARQPHHHHERGQPPNAGKDAPLQTPHRDH